MNPVRLKYGKHDPGRSNGVKKILVVRTDRLGDVLLSTPVLKATREAYPDSHIAVMVRPYTRDCVEGNPYINEVIIYDKDGIHKNLSGSLKFAMELRKKRFDMALILHPTNRVNIITFLAGIPKRVGYHRKFGFLLTNRLRHTKQFGEKHEIEYTLDIARSVGMHPSTKSMYMPISRETRRKMDGILSGMGVADSDVLVTVHPSSSCESKRWPPERFAAVADRLIDEQGVKVALISGQDGIAHADQMKKSMKHAVLDFSGKVTVSEMASLISRSELFISNDSGPVHVASAVGTPVLAIFGRNESGLSPRRWGPTGAEDSILHKPAACDPCKAHDCDKGFVCLYSINEDEVVAAASAMLKKRLLLRR